MAKNKKSKKPKSPKVHSFDITKEEQALIDHLRAFGTIPDEFLLDRDLKYKRLKEKFDAVSLNYKNALNEVVSLKSRNKIIEEVESIPVEKSIYNVKALTKKTESECIPIIVASDWHVEERVRSTTVNGLNEYSPDIAKRRIREFFITAVKLINMYRKRSTIDTVVLALLGDLITGFIHDEFRESNFMSPLNAVLFVRDEIINGISFLLKEAKLKKLIIPCSFGNHGRTSKEVRHETAADNSFEQHLYYLLEFYFKNNNRVEFIINKSYHTYLTLFDNYTVRFHHGDHIRYRGGVGGITVPVNKAVSQWDKSIKADLDVFGHFHQLMDGGKFVANGSIVGYNSFALSIKASYEPPKQAFVLIEKTYGKIATHSIILK